VEWSGDNQTIASTNDNVTTIIIQNNSNITAIFSKNGPFKLNLTTNGTGSGTIEVNKTEPYYYGDTVKIWANASIGSTFTGFFGDLQGINSPQTITMTENKTVNAEFTLDCYKLNITIIGNGSVSCEPCYPYDTEITLTPDADFPWNFSEWAGPNATELVDNEDGSWNITILNDTELTATFLEQWVNTCPVSSNESPTNKSNGIDINIGEWSVIITDADGNETSGNISCSNGKEMNWSNRENDTQPLDLDSLNYNTKYTIYLNYTDGHCIVNETFWFKTAKKQTNTNNNDKGNDGVIHSQSNQNPIANATVDKNTGYPNEIFTFNASSSKDSDGNIVNYTWDFDDGINVSTNQTMITHEFTSTGVYEVMLTVIDEKGGLGPIIIDIKQANNPPEDLIVTPEDTWTHQNKDLLFKMSANDQDDNDTIHFEIDWGEGNTTVSEPVNSSKIFEISHAWDTYGIYTVAVTAYDKINATTDTYTLTIQVDIKILDELNGWIIDRDGDGVFDQYKDLTNSTLHNIQEQETGNYLIDTNNDGIWDYDYQLANGDIHPLNTIKETEEDESFPLWGIIILIILGILAFIGLLFFKGILYIEYEEE